MSIIFFFICFICMFYFLFRRSWIGVEFIVEACRCLGSGFFFGVSVEVRSGLAFFVLVIWFGRF